MPANNGARQYLLSIPWTLYFEKDFVCTAVVTDAGDEESLVDDDTRGEQNFKMLMMMTMAMVASMVIYDNDDGDDGGDGTV